MWPRDSHHSYKQQQEAEEYLAKNGRHASQGLHDSLIGGWWTKEAVLARPFRKQGQKQGRGPHRSRRQPTPSPYASRPVLFFLPFSVAPLVQSAT
jgi:hypothetical protein